MPRRISIALLFLAFLLTSGYALAQQQSSPPQQQAKPPQTQNQPALPQAPGVQRTVGLVHLVAAVTDRRNKFVTDLTRNDFDVYEDGKEQRITYFSTQANLPLRIGMLMDTSNSIRERLHFEQDAAIDFLYNVIRRGQDQAFVMTFDNEPEVVQDYTGDVSDLSEVIQKQNAGGGTALNDAIYMASQRLLDAPTPLPKPDIRRILVVISDGDDNLSDHALSDAIQMADRSGVSIYTISTNNDWVEVDTGTPQKLQYTEGDRILKELAEETGGRAFFPFRVDDLAQSFLDIGNELRSQYLIGYTPPYKIADGQFHRVDLRVYRKGLTVRTRKGYYALPPITSPAVETVAGSAHP